MRMRASVLTGKNGLNLKSPMPWRRRKRANSIRWYSSLPLTLAKATTGDWLPVALKTPPSSTGTGSKLAPVRRSISGITR